MNEKLYEIRYLDHAVEVWKREDGKVFGKIVDVINHRPITCDETEVYSFTHDVEREGMDLIEHHLGIKTYADD